MIQPTAVALQAAFLLVLFLFVAWVVRSTLRDLRRPDEQRVAGPPPIMSLAPSFLAMSM